MSTLLRTDDLRVGYDGRVVCDGVTMDIVAGSLTAIIGPNACGKSTLLRAMARILPASAGSVLLDGRDVAAFRTKELARSLGLLPQTSAAPEGIRVADLVARGRHPHQRAFDRWSQTDEHAVKRALEVTGTTDLSGQLVDELSGGQRQRVWLAMVLAQDTPLLLLDEPTTFLDIAHQYGLLDLFRRLRDDDARTIVVVLHDLNQAARYADSLIVMKEGHVVAAGAPSDVITAEMVAHVYGLPCRILSDPETGTPMVVPLASPGDRTGPDASREPRRGITRLGA
ncbi:ABC-type cobalamin/Fe3+-siderophores transport system ATPase subunit [Microbacterium proteolyticum]|uniref:ABC transporter ATP-binding protein n=1 Tax=Microbacterium proteolyticum TaxID=1572644 RepID=UPI0027810132|nr:ABC transporter ATP-binding protein [Microbacterium proteolyticum]MDQ1169098.1 ABC-type cobalamin/Fe3+-siderophores transport system ATPase subunit [Microbacterium proteolyticum]